MREISEKIEPLWKRTEQRSISAIASVIKVVKFRTKKNKM